MRIITFKKENEFIQLAAVTDESVVYPLPFADFLELIQQSEAQSMSCLAVVKAAIENSTPIAEGLEELELGVPVPAYEVWASGVTYMKSKEARNYEAYSGKEPAISYYDKVYEAERPEIFLKSTERRTVGTTRPLYLRSDSNWQIPEPELGLVIDKKGKIIGYTIGNDMSSRDIEGENPLYLPQAKIWKHSCSIGPAIRLAETVEDPYGFMITCRIFRDGKKIFEDSASTSQLKRKYEELISFLLRDNQVFDGTVLLTGTNIVPENDFTLEYGDMIEIEIPEIGILQNPIGQQTVKKQSISK